MMLQLIFMTIRHIGQVFIVLKSILESKRLEEISEEAIGLGREFWSDSTIRINRTSKKINVLFICIRRLGLRLRAFKKRSLSCRRKFLDVYLMGKLID